jgi:hypothetical protein
MKSIMEALFDGQVIPWERRYRMSGERKAIEEKIQREKRYFMEKMSLDDCQRLEGLENLYNEAAHDEEIDIYSHGFTLGALLMQEIMEKKSEMMGE